MLAATLTALLPGGVLPFTVVMRRAAPFATLPSSQLLGVRAWLRLHFVLPDAALPGAAVPMAMPPATLLVPLRDA